MQRIIIIIIVIVIIIITIIIIIINIIQAESMSEARELYDQLAPLCPIMLALTGDNTKYKNKIQMQNKKTNTNTKDDATLSNHALPHSLVPGTEGISGRPRL